MFLYLGKYYLRSIYQGGYLLKERVHLIVNLIDNLAHEEVYHNHEELNYDNMEDIVVDIILDILKK